jgi:hypothetical protein
MEVYVTQMEDPAGQRVKDMMAPFRDDIEKLASKVALNPRLIREFTDDHLLALELLTRGERRVPTLRAELELVELIRAECVRRAESGRRFAHYLGRSEFVVSGTLHLQDVGQGEQADRS